MTKLVAKICAAVLMLLSAPYGWAQTTVQTEEVAMQAYSVPAVTERYPVGSIQTHEVAERALVDLAQVRKAIEARFAADQHDCYPKFFTTSCLNKVKESRRVDLLAVKPIEVEANAYIRQARVTERDRRQAEKAAKNEGKAILQQQALEEERTDDAGMSSRGQHNTSGDVQRKTRVDARAERIEKQAEKERNLKANEAAEEKKRAENIKRYEEKVKASAARQKEILEKKAEKERLQQQK